MTAPSAALKNDAPTQATGGSLRSQRPGHRCDISYEIVGPSDAPVVAVLGGISSSRHATSSPSDPRPGWWEAVVGPERAIDTLRFRVLSIDYLAAGEGQYVTTTDQAAALASALDDCGAPALHAVVGASYGGMVALAFGASFPTRARRLIVISAAHESDPLATALRHLQRRVVALATEVGRERDGLAIARGIAMTSYLTPRHFEERVVDCDWGDAHLVEHRIGNYLRTGGEQFARDWTSERYNALSLSLDLHRVQPEDIRTPTTVIAVSSDRLVPLAQSRQLARRLGGPVQLIEIDSPLGHDAFVADSPRIAPFINELLTLAPEAYS
ncbi:MAG: homoserine O-succinyltransferase [Gemmatimonadaceae bacterium]